MVAGFNPVSPVVRDHHGERAKNAQAASKPAITSPNVCR